MSFKFDGSLLTSDRTLVDAQVLGDMGLVDGNFTVEVNLDADAKINSSTLIMTKKAITVAYGQAGVVSSSLTMQDGLVLYAKASQSSLGTVIVSPVVGFTNVTPLDNTIYSDPNTAFIRLFESGGALKLQVAGDSNAITMEENITIGQSREVVMAIDDTNNRVFAYYKSGASYILGAILEITAINNAPAFSCSPYAEGSFADFLTLEALTVPNTLQPALITPDFEQLFANSNGGGATGGTTEDPTSLANCQILGGVFQGVSSVTGATGAESAILNTLTTAINGGAVVAADMACDWLANYFSQLAVHDSSGNSILSLYVSNSLISVYDKTFTKVADISTAPAPVVAGTLFDIQINIDLDNKKASVFSRDITLTNNTDLDISNAGGMTSTNVGRVELKVPCAIPGADNKNSKYDNLQVYPRTRTITI